MSLRKTIAAIRPYLANTPRGRMSALAYGAALYGAAMLLTRPRPDVHDAIWAFVVCLALIWGIVEQGRALRAARPKKVKTDPRSELRLHSS